MHIIRECLVLYIWMSLHHSSCSEALSVTCLQVFTGGFAQVMVIVLNFAISHMVLVHKLIFS